MSPEIEMEMDEKGIESQRVSNVQLRIIVAFESGKY